MVVMVVTVIIAIVNIFIFLFPLRKLLAKPGKKSVTPVCIIIVHPLPPTPSNVGRQVFLIPLLI